MLAPLGTLAVGPPNDLPFRQSLPQERAVSKPLDLVERQLAAYNARDLEAFLPVFSDDIEVTRLPGTAPTIQGKAAFGKFYAENRFNLPGLHAEIVGRLVMGSKIVDHERITGIAPEPIEIIVVYAIEDGLIRRMWSMLPEG
jgi:hypothetical protein